MSGTALIRPAGHTAWELRTAWATGRRVSLSLERADVDRLEGWIDHVAATDASVTIAGLMVPLDRVLAVHHPSRLGDSSAQDGDRWARRARRLAPPKPSAASRFGGAPSMSEPITLTCWDCARPWDVTRRRGQYPLRCPACTGGELGAKTLARRARALGSTSARAVNHEHQGWVCTIATPWHELPVIVRDEHDLRYLHAELAAEPAGQVDHRLTRSAA